MMKKETQQNDSVQRPQKIATYFMGLLFVGVLLGHGSYFGRTFA